MELAKLGASNPIAALVEGADVLIVDEDGNDPYSTNMVNLA